MPRALWTGAISFGLINIPVELYPAEERREFKFAMLDKRDFSPVGYKRYNKENGKEVSWENVVKGYEYEKDQYVVLSDDDFRRANVKATQTIDIKAFVPAKEIPIEYFATPYYIAPAKRGEKVYALLRETLRSTARVAIAQVVIRTTQHLAAVVPVGRALMLDTMRWPDQLRDASGLSLPAEGIKNLGITAKEAELAKRLVGDMAEHWKPSEFEDTYHVDLMRRIKEKISKGETREISRPEHGEREKPSAQVIDLTALLKESLKGGERGRKPPRRAESSASTRNAATREGSIAHARPKSAAARRKRA